MKSPEVHTKQASHHANKFCMGKGFMWIRITFHLLPDIIQLMHSFEVNIRICRPANSDVHQDEAEVNIT